MFSLCGKAKKANIKELTDEINKTCQSVAGQSLGFFFLLDDDAFEAQLK
jgi:hypothetical protein